MTINDVIEAVKGYCSSTDAFTGKPIDPATTRDQVTFGAGALGCDCTGVVTCIWPTVEVVRRAKELGANLIISHEAIFWNHGDHRDVVAGNASFKAKVALLEEWDGAVWRCHDYIHAGVPLEADGSLADGIFYGLADKLGWLDCRIERDCMDFEIPEMPARELAAYVVERLGLAGTRVIGDMDAPVRRVRIPMHILGLLRVIPRRSTRWTPRASIACLPWNLSILRRANTCATPRCSARASALFTWGISTARNQAWNTWQPGCRVRSRGRDWILPRCR